MSNATTKTASNDSITDSDSDLNNYWNESIPISTSIYHQQIVLTCLLTIVILVVIIGNTLVILAVITTRRLRTVTNCFVMSLAVADWLVGVFVMPPSIAYTLMGTWELGWILCDIWVSLDILLCTASILSLCAISVDRYLAVTEPLSYSRNHRSKRLAFGMILIVWLSSALITCPPMFGWYESGRHEHKTCRYNRNTGYVIFSAMGSFFIPMSVMLYVYLRISCVIAHRHNQLSHIENFQKSKKMRSKVNFSKSYSSEDEHSFNHSSPPSNGGAHTTPKKKEEYRREEPAEEEPPPSSEEYIKQKILPYKVLTTFLPHKFDVDVAERTGNSKTAELNLHRCSVRSTAGGSSVGGASGGVSSFRRESKTAQTLSIVMGGFIACWLPFFIFYISTPFIVNNETNALVMSYLTWLGWINSAINPFIYAFYSPDFRIAFWRLTIRHFSTTLVTT